MAVNRNGFEAATGTYSTNGGTIPAATGETALAAGLSAGNTNFSTDTTVKSGGAQSVKANFTAAGIAYVRTPTGLNSLTGAADFAHQHTGLTNNRPPSGSEFYLLQARSSGGNLYSLTWLNTGFLRIRTSGSNNLWTSTAAYVPSAFLRVAMAVKLDTTTAANSQVRVVAFAVGSDTPVTNLDSGWITAAPATANVNLDNFIAGRCNSDPDLTSFNVDDFRWDNAATDVLSASSTTFGVTGVLTPANPQLYTQQRTLTLTASGSNGNAITYAVSDWGDGTSSAGQSSNVFTHTYPSMANGAANANYTISASATQAG